MSKTIIYVNSFVTFGLLFMPYGFEDEKCSSRDNQNERMEKKQHSVLIIFIDILLAHEQNKSENKI